jgi:2',5'-phosphodiesterase
LQVTTVAQLTILQPVSCGPGCEDGLLCLVNTHLFFHPQAPHIRTLHVAAMLAEAHALAESAAADLGSTPALLFCGDLNSDLNDGMPGETHLLPSAHVHAQQVPECI